MYTTRESERLVRLPMYYNLSEDDIKKVFREIKRYYGVECE
jgi:dTDP-4-amino-4,6-dideoxygalactose transaminase